MVKNGNINNDALLVPAQYHAKKYPEILTNVKVIKK